MNAQGQAYLSGAGHFELFKDFCRQWQARLGLSDWRIYYSHENFKNCMAWCSRDYEGKCATIGLCVDLEDQEPTDAALEEWARHEVLHVLLGDISHLVNLRSISDNILSSTEHAVIRRLEMAFGGF